MEFKLCNSEIKASSAEDLTVEHWISTESKDRGNDILLSSGVIIDGKIIVLKSHGRDPQIGDTPIGKPIWIKPGTNEKGVKGLLAKTQFYDDAIGKDLWKRTTTGFYPYWSVGWNPVESKNRSEADGSVTRIVSKWYLYEYSLVGVGAQQDAVTPDLSKALMSCKVMSSKGTVKRPRTVTVNRPKPTKIDIPDELIRRVTRETVHDEIERSKGRVK